MATRWTTSLKWTTGLFFFQEDSPNDGGLFYLYLPSAVTPQPAAGKQITVQDGTAQQPAQHQLCRLCPGDLCDLPDTRLTAGVRYTYDERHAYAGDRWTISSPPPPATTADRRQRHLRSHARHLQRHHLCRARPMPAP